MSVNQLIEHGKKDGLSASDCHTLFTHGLTDGAVQKARKLGMSMKDILDLVNQYGPAFITVLTSILARMNPAPQPPPSA